MQERYEIYYNPLYDKLAELDTKYNVFYYHNEVYDVIMGISLDPSLSLDEWELV